MALSNPQLVNTLYQAGFRGEALKTAYGVAMRESGGRPDAFNGNTGTGDRSYGLFQINMLGALGPSRLKAFGINSEKQLLDPAVNARAAYQLSKGGTDFGAWGIGPNAYRSGAGYDTISKYTSTFPGVDGRTTQRVAGSPAQTVQQTQASRPALLPQYSQASVNKQRAYDLLGQVLSYATDGRVNSNIFANAVGAVDPKGTVQPPVQRVKGQPQIPATNNNGVNRMLAFAHDQVGKPYVFGSGPDYKSFDCSDLVQAAYKQIGVDLPRTTYDQIKVGKPVAWGQFRPGDLIFSNHGEHVVMYVGNGKVIAAPHTGTVVQYQPVSRFKSSFVTAKRILP